ncbi:MAG: DEAD/DEAH box helicase [Gemmatimonadaceae bacterium]
MNPVMQRVTAADARAAIARHVLGPHHVGDALGDVRLHPHQMEGVERVRQIMAAHGGALLADDVGLGKTFVALSIARDARDVMVIAPAALRDGWLAAATRSGVVVRFLSVEQLGRRGAPNERAALVIVDEAHHLRSPRTRRFAAAAELCRRARVLLLSATPVQNRLADLRVVLSLFLGERAHAMEAGDLARFIVRRVERDLAHPTSLGLPHVAPPRWLGFVADADCLERLCALPPPLPPADGGEAGALLTYSLVRQWASSRAALRAALQRRLARARAMEDALATGRLPTRGDLAAWCYADGVQQLAFPEFSADARPPQVAPLLDQVRTHMDGVRDLLAWLASSADPDVARSAALSAVLERHRGERVVAFSEYAETVSMFFRALRANARVAMLTHGGGRVAGGPMTRRDVLDRFAPGGARVTDSDRIELLLTTDVLSEGVNLQSASVVVHLDLSWNPARLEQRVGRLRRMGAARDTVTVYVAPPAAPAERLLRIEERLRQKLDTAARSVGPSGAVLPDAGQGEESGHAAPSEQRIATILLRWRAPLESPDGARPLAAAVCAPRNGAIACVRQHDAVVLACVDGATVTESRETVERLLECAGGDDRPLPHAVLENVLATLAQWLRRRLVAEVVELPALRVARARRQLLRRVDAIARRAPRHAQPRLAPLMHAARSTAVATLSAGAERVLDRLSTADLRDEAWLRAVETFAMQHARPRESAPEILAVLVLRTNP